MIMKTNKRIINRTIVILSAVLMAFCLCACVRSNNKGAKEYRNGKCYAFYPAQSEKVYEYAKSLCETDEERIYDYKLEEKGDFYELSYPDEKVFYLNKDFTDVTLSITGGAEMLTDMLRYNMKKDSLDEAYTTAFWLETEPEELDLSKIEAKLEDNQLKLYFKKYDYSFSVPLNYLKALTGKDAGEEALESYEYKNYIDPNRPMVAITYDDGPYRPVDTVLFELFAKYGGRATFYVVGSRMDADELDSMAYGLKLGMELGSHTEYHDALSSQSKEDALWAVMEPVRFVKEKLNYEMKTYRPPYELRNSQMEAEISLPTITWNVDSKDWSNRDEDITYQRIMDRIDNYDVVLMHSLYMSSARASERLVPELIDMGYQLVTVTELMEQLGVEDAKFFCGK